VEYREVGGRRSIKSSTKCRGHRFMGLLSTESVQYTTMQHVEKFFVMYSNIYPKRCNVTQFILSGNCSMFWVVPPPILWSTNNCIYSNWYLSLRRNNQQDATL
jgi:hypothetical protein